MSVSKNFSGELKPQKSFEMENNRKRSGKGAALRACIMFSACLLPVNVSAYDIEKDGLFYTVDSTLDSCDVAKVGSVKVPSNVMLKTREFEVPSLF